jgi:hypothetical protein
LFGQFLFVFAVVALSGPGRIDIVDGQTRYEVARSLVEYGDSVLRDPQVWFAVLKGRDGKNYTNYRFPQTGLGVLAIWAADATGPVSEERRHFFFALISPLMAAILAVVYSLWFRGLGLGAAASLAWGTAGIFCTPSWYYGTSTFDDMLCATGLVAAVATAFLGRSRPLLSAAAAGLLLGWTFNCKQPLAAFLPVVLAAGYRPQLPLRRQLAPAALVLAGLAVGVVGYKLYDWYKFPPGTTDPGEEAVRVYGTVWTASPLPGLAGLLVSPSAGMIWYCPTLLLSIPGWVRWRREQRAFTDAVLFSSVVYTLFLCFLTFFKGEPCWGPRYLTPAFALWWVFVPAGVVGMRRGLVVALLGLGIVVQLLGLSVDPVRLFLRKVILFNYYTADPWLGFDPAISHLFQRPRELREILTEEEPAAAYAPASVPTFSGQIPSPLTTTLTSTIGLLASPSATAPLDAAGLLDRRLRAYLEIHFQTAARRYHIFAGLRPWFISQWYLAPDERPVAMGGTLALLAVLAGLGLGGMLLARTPLAEG